MDHPRSMRAPFIIACCRAIIAASIALASNARCADLEASLRGQLSSIARLIRSNGSWDGDGTLRYVPQLTLAIPLGPGRVIDLEVAANSFGQAETNGESDADLELYRLKLRLATQRTETRLGLQQLNFGPAYVLRPLRWFDVLDPRDPLMLTDGVYALGFKYTSRSNASIWLWGLYGNDEPKGYETAPSADDKAELGGRFQVPVPAGEMAVTMHRRMVAGAAPLLDDYEERRFAMDGRWDAGIAFWIEAAFTQTLNGSLPYEWNTMATIGADYTFPIGSGIHVLTESMAIAASKDPFEWDQHSWISALSVGYSIGYMDRSSAIATYSWEDDAYSIYADWTRSWDRLAFHLAVFRYPEASPLGSLHISASPYSVSGAQITVVFNH